VTIDRKSIPLDQIDPNPYQPRTIFDEEELSNLTTSSEATDQVVTIGVYQYKDRYIVFDGERRVRAARKLGWDTIRADVHGALTTLDPLDSIVLEMLEKADIANNQRSDITTMEKSRSRDFLFTQGVEAKRYVVDKGSRAGESSIREFARRLGASEDTVMDQIRAAQEERGLSQSFAVQDSKLTEDYKHYRNTSCLRDDPVTRVELITLATAKDESGNVIISSSPKLLDVAKAVASNPGAKADIIAEVKSGVDIKVIRDVSEVSAGLDPSARKSLIELRLSENIRKDELPVMAQVLKENPELSDYALDLKDSGHSVEDVVASVNYVKARPPTEQEAIIEAGLVFSDEMTKATKAAKKYKKEYAERNRAAARKASVESLKIPEMEAHRVLVGDFRDLAEAIPDSSIDMIFTDPPYDEASIPLYEELAIIAARVLKPGGSLIAYCGQYALDKILPSMSRHMRFWWLLAIKHSGGFSSLSGKKTFVCWKPMVWYVKDHNGAEEFVFDLVESDPPTKELHNWEQSLKEAGYYIEKLTVPGAIVLDLFCGSGTTCVAAKRLGRKSIAFENDETTAKIAIKRIYDAN
jgi:ParB/RepB/Spo0J family partition protein